MCYGLHGSVQGDISGQREVTLLTQINANTALPH